MEQKNLAGGIIAVAIAVLAFNLLSESTITGKATTNIIACEDTDGGQVPEGGDVIGSYNPTLLKSDFCVNSTTLGEFYCDGEFTDGASTQIFCEYGCVETNQQAHCQSQDVFALKCEDTCLHSNRCLNLGTRINEKFCSFNLVMQNQKPSGECNDHFECKSNLCISGQCVTEQGGLNFLKDVESTFPWE